MLDQHFYGVYQKYAKYYNFYFGRLMNPGRLKAIEFAELKSGEKVLEVGVGTGLSLPFYPADVEVTGIDLSPAMLKRAKELVAEEGLKNIQTLEVMNAEEMEFPENSFDVVMAMHVATVVGNPHRFLNEMRRVCKPGGRIVIVNYFHDPNSPVGKVSTVLAPYAKYIGWRTDLTLEGFLGKTGLKIEKAVQTNLFNIHNVFLVRNEK
jgi:phosphatidylethanolamine/phosphatidyl-N-methylethanolamine N-methyltransferase